MKLNRFNILILTKLICTMQFIGMYYGYRLSLQWYCTPGTIVIVINEWYCIVINSLSITTA